MTTGIQKVLVNLSHVTMQSTSDKVKVVFRDIWHSADYYKQPTKRGRLSVCNKYLEIDLDNEVNGFLILDGKFQSGKLKGKGLETNMLTNIINNWTRLEVLVGLKLSGRTVTLTETRNLIDKL